MKIPSKEEITHRQTCCKCKGRTALVSGFWFYTPDQEPYENGKEEDSEVGDSEAYMNGFVCDECNTIQGVFIDEQKYLSAMHALQAKSDRLQAELEQVKAEREMYEKAFFELADKLDIRTRTETLKALQSTKQ